MKGHSNLFARHEGRVTLALTCVADQGVRGILCPCITSQNCSVKAMQAGRNAFAQEICVFPAKKRFRALQKDPRVPSPPPTIFWLEKGGHFSAPGRDRGFVSERAISGIPGCLRTCYRKMITVQAGASDGLPDHCLLYYYYSGILAEYWRRSITAEKVYSRQKGFPWSSLCFIHINLRL
jgi:hypothetical protein